MTSFLIVIGESSPCLRQSWIWIVFKRSLRSLSYAAEGEARGFAREL
jgi:hypothetical protein